MTFYPRRSFLKKASLSVTGASVIPAVSIVPAMAQTYTEVPDAFEHNFELKPLNFNPSQLDGLSEKLITSHWQNNYGGSVRALNAIKQRLQEALAEENLPAFVYNDLKREHLMRTGSVILHEYYFDNIAPPSSNDSELDRSLVRAFGSVNNWEKEFRRIGAGLGGGSGWVMLAWNLHTKSLENYWMSDHMHSPVSSLPILVMDMYEHSYHMDYGANASQYIDAFIRNINWEVIAQRLNNAIEVKV